MIDMFEKVLTFLGIIYLSNYNSDGFFDRDINKVILEKIEKKKTDGAWYFVIKTITESYLKYNKDLFIKEFLCLFNQKHKKKNILKYIDSIIDLRNKKHGHSDTLSEKEYKELFDNNIKKIETILEKIIDIKNYQLISVETLINNKMRDYIIWEGESNTSKFDDFIKINNNINIYEGYVILLSKKNPENLLSLSPFCIKEYDEDNRLNYLLFTNHNINQLSTIYYDRIKPSQKTDKTKLTRKKDYNSRKPIFDHFNKIFNDLNNSLNKQGNISQNQTDNNYYKLQHNEDTKKSYNKTFIGREKEIRHIDNFIKKNKKGFIFILGNLGQGKTSLMSKLADIYDKSVYHFFSNKELACNPKNMIKTLMGQLKDIHHLDYKIKEQDDYENYIKDFYDLLDELSKKLSGYNQIIIIDALDEMDRSIDKSLRFIIDKLPDKIFIIISSRPDGFIEDCYNNLKKSKINILNVNLEELTKEETIQYIDKNIKKEISTNDKTLIYEKTKGYAAFLVPLIYEINDGRYNNIDKIPTDLNSFYHDFLSKLKIDKIYDISIYILGVLVISRKHLSIRDLRSILPEYRFKIEEVLYHKLKNILKDYGGYYDIYHDIFIQYLNKEIFTEDDVMEFHDKIIDYMYNKDNIYKYNYLFYHLYESKRYDEIIKLIKENDSKTGYGYTYSEEKLELDLISNEQVLDDHRYWFKIYLNHKLKMSNTDFINQLINYYNMKNYVFSKTGDINRDINNKDWDVILSDLKLIIKDSILKFKTLLSIGILIINREGDKKYIERIYDELKDIEIKNVDYMDIKSIMLNDFSLIVMLKTYIINGYTKFLEFGNILNYDYKEKLKSWYRKEYEHKEEDIDSSNMIDIPDIEKYSHIKKMIYDSKSDELIIKEINKILEPIDTWPAYDVEYIKIYLEVSKHLYNIGRKKESETIFKNISKELYEIVEDIPVLYEYNHIPNLFLESYFDDIIKNLIRMFLLFNDDSSLNNLIHFIRNSILIIISDNFIINFGGDIEEIAEILINNLSYLYDIYNILNNKDISEKISHHISGMFRLSLFKTHDCSELDQTIRFTNLYFDFLLTINDNIIFNENVNFFIGYVYSIPEYNEDDIEGYGALYFNGLYRGSKILLMTQISYFLSNIGEIEKAKEIYNDAYNLAITSNERDKKMVMYSILSCSGIAYYGEIFSDIYMKCLKQIPDIEPDYKVKILINMFDRLIDLNDNNINVINCLKKTTEKLVSVSSLFKDDFDNYNKHYYEYTRKKLIESKLDKRNKDSIIETIDKFKKYNKEDK